MEAVKAARGVRGAGRGRGTSGSMGWHGDVAIGATGKVCSQWQSTPMFHELSLAYGITLSLSPLRFLMNLKFKLTKEDLRLRMVQ